MAWWITSGSYIWWKMLATELYSATWWTCILHKNILSYTNFALRLWHITNQRKIAAIYRISQPIRRPFFSEKCDLNSTCILSAEGKYYFQTYKYPYIYYTISLSCDSEICFQIMRSGFTACEQLTFLSGDIPWRIHYLTCDSGYLRCCSSKV